MIKFLPTTSSILITVILFASCQREEEREVEAVNKLMQESEGSFPQTMEETKELQKEVKQLNIQIKEQSQQRIEEINRELEKQKNSR